MITGHAVVPFAIQAMKAGVRDFVEKPFVDELLVFAIRKALAEHTEEKGSASREQSRP